MHARCILPGGGQGHDAFPRTCPRWLPISHEALLLQPRFACLRSAYRGDVLDEAVPDVPVLHPEHPELVVHEPYVQHSRVRVQPMQKSVRYFIGCSVHMFGDGAAAFWLPCLANVVRAAGYGVWVNNATAGVMIRHVAGVDLYACTRSEDETRVFLVIFQYPRDVPELDQAVPVEPVSAASRVGHTDGAVPVRCQAAHVFYVRGHRVAKHVCTRGTVSQRPMADDVSCPCRVL